MQIFAVRISMLDNQTLDELCAFVDFERRFKVSRLKNPLDKTRTLVGDLLIRLMIMKELKVKNENLQFELNSYGKPYLKNYPNFNFNVSHSGDFLVCAIDDRPVGIDVEQILDIECRQIAKDFFSLNEFNYIVCDNKMERLNRFYEIWTLKESYIKCCGQGLSIPLKSFSIDIDNYGTAKVFTNNEKKGYAFKRFILEENYRIAVCSIKEEISTALPFRLEQKSLINNYLEYIKN